MVKNMVERRLQGNCQNPSKITAKAAARTATQIHLLPPVANAHVRSPELIHMATNASTNASVNQGALLMLSVH